MTICPDAALIGDLPAAASAQGLADRNALAFVAMERTRMPMVITDPRQPDNPIVLANRAFLELTGYGPDEVIGHNCRFLHGENTDSATIAEIRTAIAERREITVDIVNYRKDGESFWNQLMISPVRDQRGALLYFFASQMNVTRRRKALELEHAEHLLLREIDHRAKNALALVQGIVRLSRADDAEAYARSVQGRVDALARAHALLSDARWREVPLDRLVHTEVEPFGTRRIAIAGSNVALDAAHVQPLAILLHELLANAAEHGALSGTHGDVGIDWSVRDDGDIQITWHERGGPQPSASRRRGFGTAMIDAIVRRQLRGEIAYDWRASGLAATIIFPMAHVSVLAGVAA